MENLLRDLRYGGRLFLANPGLAAVALVSLALGIGANTTIFSALNAVLLRSAPVKEPDRIVVLYETNPKQGMRVSTPPVFERLRQNSKTIEAMALADEGGGGPATLVDGKGAVRVSLGSVGTDFFAFTRVSPILGRTFLAEDENAAPGAGNALVLSHEFWQRWYGGDRSVLGRQVAADGTRMTIIGVMPPRFWLFPWSKDADGWIVVNVAANPNSRWLLAVGRLRKGVTLEQARAEMDTLFRPLATEDPAAYKGWSVLVESLEEFSVGGWRQTFYMLLGAVGFVLLIACANVANLLLVHASARRKEFAVRASMGASRLRLVRQLLAECTALAVAGGLLGLVVAFWGIRIFAALAPKWFMVSEAGMDSTVLAFAFALSLITGLISGASPAIHIFRTDLNEPLKEAGGRTSGGGRSRVRSVLVVVEVSLALILLMGAGLMMNSFVRLRNVDLGYDPQNLLRAEVFLGGKQYWNSIGGDMKRVSPQADLFFQRLIERARNLPGVASAAVGSMERSSPNTFQIAGRPPVPPESRPRVSLNEVSGDFFRTLGVKLVKGRFLTDRDAAGAPWAVVVSESFAKRFFAKEDPIGQVLYFTIYSWGAGKDVEEGRPREVVGVVKDIKYYGPRSQPVPVVYGSYWQHPTDYPGGSYSMHLWTKLVLRTSGSPEALGRPVEQVVKDIDKEQVAFNIMPMERRLAEFVAPQRFWLELFGVFGGLAVLLAVIGIYGVMSYSVSRRTHEIGVRMAAGARRLDILRLVLGHGLKLALIGVAIGIGGALALTRLIGRYLFGVTPNDPATFTAVSLILIAVALGACYIPARRATQVDPMAALRYE